MKYNLLFTLIAISTAFKDDLSSVARHSKIFQTHISFDLTVDLPSRTLIGSVTIHFERASIQSSLFHLDYRDLQIFSVFSDKEPLLFATKVLPKANIGHDLIVVVPPKIGLTGQITIHYATMPSSNGIHFSSKSLRESEYEFMYTHGEAILARTYFPCQDTPALKITSSAKITVSKPYTALFTGIETKRKEYKSKTVFEYENRKKISTYLINFAVGKVVKKQLHNKLIVYGEEKYLKNVEKAFKDFDKYYKFLEKSLGKFHFKHFGFLIVPEDFPFSGTENPYLISLNVSVIKENSTSAMTIPHEMIHFWSGNLVTNHDWSDFWLNEGITTYVTIKAAKHMYGKNEEIFEFDMEMFKLQKALLDLKKLKTPKRKLKLKPKLIYEDPYESFSRLPYSKGALVMRMIENVIGENRVLAMLRKYFENFKYKTIRTEQMIAIIKKEIGKTTYNRLGLEGIIFGDKKIKYKYSSKRMLNLISVEKKIKKGNVRKDEIKQLYNRMNIKDQHWLVGKLTDSFEKMNRNIKREVINFMSNVIDRKEHEMNVLRLDILQESDGCKREKIFEERFVKTKHLGFTFVRKLFMDLKAKPCRNLDELLRKYEWMLNRITVVRIKELIAK